MTAGGYVHNVGVLLAEVARRHPADDALVFADGRVSHADLDGATNRVARHLRSLGVGRRDVVAVYAEKELATYSVLLGAMKLGAVVTTLDDHTAHHRFLRKIRTASPAVLVVDRALPAALVDRCRQHGVRVVDLGELWHASLADDPGPLEDTALVTGTDPAYIMFTSGSTGAPKGAVMTHANLVNFAGWARQELGIGPGDVLTGVNPIYFDNSVFDLYASVLNGAAVAPISADIARRPADLVTEVERRGCTVWFSVPSLLVYLTTMRALDPDRLPTIRAFVFGGEGYPKSELRKLHDLYGERAELVNVYGPTECTCICSAHRVVRTDLGDDVGLVPLGRIAPNFACVVADEEGHDVGDGEVGELVLYGPNVGLGYYGEPELTERAFPVRPGAQPFVERGYRTGDLVRRDADGLLHFVGRADNQIKRMGYRIELEEIEAALDALPDVHEALVVHRRNGRFDQLVAIVGAAAGADPEVLAAQLAERVPAYLRPDRIRIVATLPKNRNGKIDRAGINLALVDDPDAELLPSASGAFIPDR
ncbi:MAG: amino acid adenylation domain-containing protein [Actinomycetota bacterium]